MKKFRIKSLPKAQKGVIKGVYHTDDLDDYTFRKAAYDDSLALHFNNLEPLSKPNVQWIATGKSNDPYSTSRGTITPEYYKTFKAPDGKESKIPHYTLPKILIDKSLEDKRQQKNKTFDWDKEREFIEANFAYNQGLLKDLAGTPHNIPINKPTIEKRIDKFYPVDHWLYGPYIPEGDSPFIYKQYALRYKKPKQPVEFTGKHPDDYASTSSVFSPPMPPKPKGTTDPKKSVVVNLIKSGLAKDTASAKKVRSELMQQVFGEKATGSAAQNTKLNKWLFDNPDAMTAYKETGNVTIAKPEPTVNTFPGVAPPRLPIRPAKSITSELTAVPETMTVPVKKPITDRKHHWNPVWEVDPNTGKFRGSQSEEEPSVRYRFQEGGEAFELELTPEEIQWYLDNGYNVEKVSDYQDGGEIISSNGWDYKKEGDQYFTRKTGTSQWITPTGNALTAIKQKVFNELPYTAADRRADYLKNLETLVNQGYTIDDLVNMGMGTKAGLTSILGTTETATPQVSETVNPVQQKSYWDPYNYGNKYTMTGIEQPSFNLDMSSVNNFALSKEPENVAYAKELRKEGKALTPTEQQAFDINYDPYQMAVDRFTIPKPVYNQEVFTAREKLPVSNYWNPMFATYAEAMGQLFNPEVPEYSNQQSTLDRAFEVAKMFGDKESIVPQEQSLPINYNPRMSAQKDAEYRAARNFWDNKTKDLEDANTLFDKETLYSIQDYKKNWPAYAKRYLTKKGYLKPDAVETDYEDTKQKIEEKPRVDTFFEKLENSQDKHYKNTTGAKLMKFRHQWDGDEGFTYYVTKPKSLDRNPSETYENVEGVGHFALDANPLKGSTNVHRNNFTYVRNNILNDEYIPIYKQSLEKNKINMSYKKPSEMTPEEVKALDIFKKYDEKFKKATSNRMKDQVAKEYAEEIDDSDVKIVEPLRQLAFDDIDFSSGKKAPTFKNAKYIQTKDGKETKLLYTNPSKKAYGRFDGAGVSFIFKDKYGNTIVRDFAGSIVDIQEEGKNIKKQYNLKDGDLIVGYHDVGSFSAKPAAQDGKLRISDFDTYNDSPGTGTALIIPSSPQTPLLNEFYK